MTLEEGKRELEMREGSSGGGGGWRIGEGEEGEGGGDEGRDGPRALRY